MFIEAYEEKVRYHGKITGAEFGRIDTTGTLKLTLSVTGPEGDLFGDLFITDASFERTETTLKDLGLTQDQLVDPEFLTRIGEFINGNACTFTVKHEGGHTKIQFINGPHIKPKAADPGTKRELVKEAAQWFGRKRSGPATPRPVPPAGMASAPRSAYRPAAPANAIPPSRPADQMEDDGSDSVPF